MFCGECGRSTGARPAHPHSVRVASPVESEQSHNADHDSAPSLVPAEISIDGVDEPRIELESATPADSDLTMDHDAEPPSHD